MAATTAPTAFARAIDEFIRELQDKSDKNSEFYKQVLAEINSGSFHGDSQASTRKFARNLEQAVDEIKAKHLAPTKSHRLADGLGTFVTAFNQYAVAFDAMLQAAPAAAQLLYGGARVVLLLAQRVVDCYDTVVVILEDISYNINCYHKFAIAYEATADIQDLLVKSYKAIVNFWLRASRLLTTRALKVLVSRNSQLSKEWQKYRVELQRWRERVEFEAQAAEALKRKQNEDRVAIEQAETAQRKQMQKLVDWVKGPLDGSVLDFRAIVRENEEARHPGTCEWIFQDPRYQQWFTSRRNETLWLHSHPGTGKSILSSVIVKTLEQERQKVACYFYPFNDGALKRSMTSIRSIMIQLIAMYKQENKSVPDAVQRLVETDAANHCEHLKDPKVALQAVKALLKSIGRVHIVIDGLDECEDRHYLTRVIIKELMSVNTFGIVKFLFASRPEKEMADIFRNANTIEIDTPMSCLLTDVRQFMSDKLEQDIGMECSHCIDDWIAKSEGNFLWAHHTLRILKGEDFVCEEDLDEALNAFPVGLKGYYERTLQQLVRDEKRTHPQIDLAKKIFTLVVAAVQPLRLSEITHALAACRSSENDDYNVRKIPRAHLIQELSSGLIKFDTKGATDESDPYLKFGHKSIRDFFVQDPNAISVPDEIKGFFTTEAEAALLMGQCCLKYLCFRRYNEICKIPEIEKPEHSFLKHAASFWHLYLGDAGIRHDIVKEVVRFLQSPAFWNCVYVQLHIVPHMFARFYQHADGFTIHSSRPGGLEDRERVFFATPLPLWLDESGEVGHKLVVYFQKFVMRWHPTLNTHAGAFDQCIMDTTWANEATFAEVNLDDKISSWAISSPSLSTTNITTIRSLSIDQDGSLAVDAYNYDRINPDGNLQQLKWTFDLSTRNVLQSGIEPLPTRKGSNSKDNVLLSVDKDSNATFLSLKDLITTAEADVASVGISKQQTSDASAAGTWRISGRPSPAGSAYCITNVFSDELDCECEDPDEPTEDDVTSVSADDSGYGDGEDDAADEKSTNKRCMIVSNPFGETIRSFSTLENAGFDTNSAIDKNRKLAVWSEQPFQLSIANLVDGQITQVSLPEPDILVTSSPIVQQKVFHFRDEDQALLYLCATADRTAAGIELNLTLSTLSLGKNDEDAYTLTKSTSDSSITYSCVSRLRAPFLLATFTPTHLYALLPNLSCNARLIRIPIQPPSNTITNIPTKFQTHHTSLYLPATTPDRSPILTQLASPTSPSHSHLILTLDADPAINPTDTHLSSKPADPALILSWRLHNEDDWRDWDEKRDGVTEDYKLAAEVRKRLRGDFVDGAQRFSVPIRSGLDWTRKAVVSCM